MNMLKHCIILGLFLSNYGCAEEKSNITQNELQLVIVSTTTQEKEAVLNARTKLGNTFPKLTTINSGNCENLKPKLVLFVAESTENSAQAKNALKEAQKSVPDSYVRNCTIKQNSLLSHKAPYIHSSIFQLSEEEQFNWSFEDMASSVFSIGESNTVFLEKSFHLIPSEPGDGRQSKLYNVEKTRKDIILEQCWNFNIAESSNNMLLFQCMTGVAANEIIHTVYSYQLQTKKMVFEKSHCRNAKISNINNIECEQESVDEYGELTLTKSDFKIK